MATSAINPNDPNLTLEQLQAAYKAELEKFNAETQATIRADEEAFAKARAEIEAMAAQEQDVIRQQTVEYETAQQRIFEQTQAQAQAAALEQAKIQKQMADIKAQQEAEAARARGQIEGIQRESAERVSASRRAARTSGGRPLLGAATMATMSQPGSKLGGEGSLAGEVGTLGATQTLGV